MRRILDYLTTRYGLASIVALMVVAIVIVGRVVGGGEIGFGLSGGGDRPSSRPTQLEDQLVTRAPAPTPVVVSGQPGPVEIGAAFATAWANHKIAPDAWRAAVSQYASPAMTERLKTSDPLRVPADRVTGKAELGTYDALWAEVAVGMDAGTLRLSLVSISDRWLVDGVDWARS